jgi:hypothetical protein
VCIKETNVPKTIGKLRLTVMMEWKVEDLKQYNAKTMKQAAALTKKQLEDGDASFEDAMTWGDIKSFKVEAVKP